MTTTIRQADLIESVAAALQYISYYHPADFIAHLARAWCGSSRCRASASAKWSISSSAAWPTHSGWMPSA